jgi:hypothetical protein
VDLLCLLSAGHLTGTNGPDGLVRDNNVLPRGLAVQLLLEGSKLLGDDLDCLAGLALLKGLATAPDDANAAIGGVLGLGGDDGVRVAEVGAALGVAQDGPGDVAVLELGDRDLAGEGAVGLVEDVLGSDFDARAEVLADQEEVERWRGDDNLGVGVQLSLVQVLDNGLDGLDVTIPAGVTGGQPGATRAVGDGLW